MNNYLPNPFTEAYVTHTVTEQMFARYFSPKLVASASQVFQTGNVIVRGTQGSGKSMLLRLLDPEIRIAYSDLANNPKIEKQEPFPVPVGVRDFVSTRVDLNKSGLLDIINTLPLEPSGLEVRNIALAFGDFLNFWLIRGLLNNIERMQERSDVFENLIGSKDTLDQFASSFAKEDCFDDGLEEVTDWTSLKEAVRQRVIHYRAWSNGNRDLPDSVQKTKTAIGEPIGRAEKLLRTTGVFTRVAHIFCSIDQIEALWFQSEGKRQVGGVLRREIHELLGKRDNRAYYRIGVRRHDWDKEGNLAMREGRSIEEGRDFLITDIDELLRKDEHTKNWAFRNFARDVFQRRVQTAMDGLPGLPKNLHHSSDFFGPSPDPQGLVAEIVKNPDPQKLLKLDDTWPEPWQKAIMDCYYRRLEWVPSLPGKGIMHDPLNARLLVAWGAQAGVKGGKPRMLKETPPQGPDDPPWNKAKQYWRKERYPQAILQLSSRHNQKLLWWGEPKVLSLSGANILRFLTISRSVWDYWQRLEPESSPAIQIKPIVSPSTQASAILDASRKIHESLKRQPGNPAGDVRIAFLDQLARWLRNQMLEDAAMSYPGGNGVSLRDEELARYPELKQLIHEAVGWGDLYEREHTSKSKNDSKRTKYYPNPALSPMYQLPEVHTKEPVYVSPTDILRVAKEAGAVSAGLNEEMTLAKPSNQLGLFDKL